MRSIVSSAAPLGSCKILASAVDAFFALIRWLAEYSPTLAALSSSYRPCFSSISTLRCTSPAGR